MEGNLENGAVRAEFSISYYRGLRRYRLRFSHRAEHSRMGRCFGADRRDACFGAFKYGDRACCGFSYRSVSPARKSGKGRGRRSRLRLCRDIVYHWFTHLLAEDMLAEDSYNYFTLPKMGVKNQS